jgi:hypothetical protein
MPVFFCFTRQRYDLVSVNYSFMGEDCRKMPSSEWNPKRVGCCVRIEGPSKEHAGAGGRAARSGRSEILATATSCGTNDG